MLLGGLSRDWAGAGQTIINCMHLITFKLIYRAMDVYNRQSMIIHLFTSTLFTNIGVKQVYMLGSDGVRQLNLHHEAFISYILQESMGHNFVINLLIQTWM